MKKQFKAEKKAYIKVLKIKKKLLIAEAKASFLSYKNQRIEFKYKGIISAKDSKALIAEGKAFYKVMQLEHKLILAEGIFAYHVYKNDI